MTDPAPAARPPAAPVPAPLSDEACAEVRGKLAAAVRRVCPSWLSAQADDIVQCALIRVMAIQGTREGNASLSASYLWKVAYCATVDEIRRLRRRREAPLEDATLAESPIADPERSRAGREVAEAVRDCLRTLVEPRRLAVALHLQGHTVPEASRILGWNEKRMENLVYRGLADLRRCLTSKGIAP